MNNDSRSFLSVGAFIFGVIALVFGSYAIANSAGDAHSLSTTSTAAVVDITLSEFKMTPEMVTVPPGDVTVRVTNGGTIAHSLTFVERNVATRDLQPGESQTITLKNVEAGDMTFICTIPGHADSGMKGMLMAVNGAPAAGSADAATPTTMSYQQMDQAMTDAALAFVNDPKGTFGGTPLEPIIKADGTKEFDLTAKIVDWEVSPGKIVKAWTYNGMVPGPEMRVDVGDKVEIVLTNELPESTSLHLHGIRVPNAMDGVDPYTQDPILPGATFTYAFTALEPAVGMYHSHHDAQTQVPNGMAGAFLIGDMPIPAVLAAKGITQVDKLVNMVLNDAGTIGLTLNGKSFPATEAYTMKVGQTMEVNYFNEGLMSHPMHLHQPTGWIIAKDGVPLIDPMPADTVVVAPGERYTVLYHFVDPGVWAWHCHILNHAEGPNGMFGMVTAVIVS
ncbi:MAG: putative multicopper oxidase [Ilumatobacteraceae bacterium]|nr:putative multicopper oxidase [Ilumatobacteraceae bacterium]